MALLATALITACGSQEPPSAGSSAAAPTATAATAAPSDGAAAAAVPAAGVPLLEQELAYGEGQKTNLVGFLAMPGDAAEPLPGIILVHEWWGLNEDIKAVARKLAAERYIVLAVDLYGGQLAGTPEQAQTLMGSLFEQPDAVRGNLRQAYDYLEKYAFAPRIGAVGFGMGGGWSLQTGLLLPDMLDAVVMYYGQVVVDRSQLAPLKMPILGFFGSEDRTVPVREVQDFRTSLQDSGKIAEILLVPGANQGFASPSSAAYNPQAAADTWAQTVAFLSRNLQLGTVTR